MGEFENGWSMREDTKFINKVKVRPQFFYLVFQDGDLKITGIEHGNNYDILWERGIEKAKESGGFWSVWSIHGKFINGNFVSR